jgi:hypothetical protein
MSYEDQQFEVARRVVTLGAEATKAAAQGAQTGGGPAAQIAKDAVLQAAQTHAPGLAAAVSTNGHGRMGRASIGGGGGRRTGRWYRRGTRIVIVGA